MSRIRTGHSPDDWLLQPPATPGYRSKTGIRGSLSNPVIFGSFPVGTSHADKNRQASREFQARKRDNP